MSMNITAGGHQLISVETGSESGVRHVLAGSQRANSNSMTHKLRFHLQLSQYMTCIGTIGS